MFTHTQKSRNNVTLETIIYTQKTCKRIKYNVQTEHYELRKLQKMPLSLFCVGQLVKFKVQQLLE